jgi:hypothetical protein
MPRALSTTLPDGLAGGKTQVHGCYVLLFHLYDVHFVQLLDERLGECRLAGLGTEAVYVALYLCYVALLVLLRIDDLLTALFAKLLYTWYKVRYSLLCLQILPR